MDKNIIPNYDINVDDIDTPMYAVSLVSEPAIKVFGFAFSDLNKEKFEYKFDTVEGILVAPILIPDIKILRQDPITKEYYTVSFPKSVIQTIRDKFNKNFNGNVLNIEHSNRKINAYLVEHWIKDFDVDKSNEYGFDCPIGTYFVKVKFEDKKWFFDNVINGNLKGLSIEIDANLAPQNKFTSHVDAFTKSLSDKELLVLQSLLFNNVSFDWDDTLEKPSIQEIAKNEVEDGENVFIISARNQISDQMKKVAEDIGIPLKNIFAVGSNNNKIEKIKELNIDTHFDNNKDVIDAIDDKGELVLSDSFSFEILRGDANSSNIKSWIYNSKKKTLFITFNDKSKYKYYGITGSEFKNVINGNAACLTSGNNKYGSWWIGKYPSQGAALYRYVINNDKRYEKV